MTQQQLTFMKFAAILLVLVGGFVLVGFGRIDAASMYAHTATMVAALVVALGISGAGSAAAAGQQNAARMAAFDRKDHQ